MRGVWDKPADPARAGHSRNGRWTLHDGAVQNKTRGTTGGPGAGCFQQGRDATRQLDGTVENKKLKTTEYSDARLAGAHYRNEMHLHATGARTPATLALSIDEVVDDRADDRC